MNERKPPLPSLATAFLSALILIAGCAKGTPTMTAQCSSNQDECNGTCVNVQTDNQNCGSCGKTCGTGTTCQNGTCACASGLVSCNSQCVASNAMHCGSSCTACTGSQVCSGNGCTDSCPSGSMKCTDGACSSNGDSAHCGTSCTACPAGSSCNNGVCGCGANQMLCGSTCTDVTTTAHCGSCTNACTAGQSCTNGQCVGGGSVGGNSGGGQGGMTGGGLGGNGTAGNTGSQGGMTGGGGSTRPATCAAGPDTISDFEEGTTGITIPEAGRQGWWYTFSDPNNGQQTPAKNATGPIMTAMADGTDTNAGTCGMNKWAMHSTSSGHINYVGFGTSIAQVLPAPPATATTTKTKNPYDTTTSMYDGVVFDIKSGSGTAPNVWFELANSENQPQPDGTIKTADGTAAGAASSPSSNATDEYNTRGKLLTNVTTTWQTVYVPFGLLAPRYLPAQATTGPCANNAIFCEAPAFNPKSLLGLQFSVYDQFPKTGTTAGTYDLWVDNVAFYKGANGVATFTASPNTANPFPQDKAVGSCVKPTGASGKFLVDMYLRWKNRFVVTSGGQSRVIRPENNNDTVSEGIGYGMLIAVYMGDRTLFDGLYAYWVAKGVGGAASTLMTWCQPGGGGTGTSCSGGGSATDADEDVAWALVQAGKQWGGTYAASAATMIGQIFTQDVDGSNFIKGGNAFGGMNLTNPSYFAPAYYRVFATIDTGHPWATVITTAYTALNAIAGTFTGGLVPAWCSNSCASIGSNGAADDGKYQYDAHRVPWRIGLDACWNSAAVPATAKTFLLNNTTFFAGKATNGIGRVFDIYQMGGVVSSDGVPNSMSAVGSAGVGAMVNAGSNATAKSFLDRAYRFVLDASYTSDPASATTGYTYFNATVGLLTAITMSGNFNSF